MFFKANSKRELFLATIAHGMKWNEECYSQHIDNGVVKHCYDDMRTWDSEANWDKYYEMMGKQVIGGRTPLKIFDYIQKHNIESEFNNPPTREKLELKKVRVVRNPPVLDFSKVKTYWAIDCGEYVGVLSNDINKIKINEELLFEGNFLSRENVRFVDKELTLDDYNQWAYLNQFYGEDK